MTSTVPVNKTSESRPDTISGMAISLAFWIGLILAALLFALVALSPKFLIYLGLRNQFDNNQMRLLTLERQAGQLQRVIDAIRSDKEFASELTRVEFDAVRPGEEVIPVETALKLDSRSLQSQPPAPVSEPQWYLPVVQRLATDAELRRSLLLVAVLLVVVAFAILQPAGVKRVSSDGRVGNLIWRSLRGRYLR